MSYEELTIVVNTIISILGIYVMMHFFDFLKYRLYLRHNKIYEKIFKIPPLKVLEEEEEMRRLLELIYQIYDIQ